MKKAIVLEIGVSCGHLLEGRHVALLTRPGKLKNGIRRERCVRLRHAWPDGTDARAWDAIRRAARDLAREVASARGGLVAVFDCHDNLLELVGHTS